jgi:WD40 repeat protein
MTISHDGQWLSVASNGLGKGAIQVYSVKNEFIHWWTLPCTEAPVSCIKFLGCDLIQPALAVACNNGVFYLFDVEQRRLSDWSEDLGFPASKSLPRELSMCPDCPDSIAFNPSAPNKVVMVRTDSMDIKVLFLLTFVNAKSTHLVIYMEDIEIFSFFFHLLCAQRIGGLHGENIFISKFTDSSYFSTYEREGIHGSVLST